MNNKFLLSCARIKCRGSALILALLIVAIVSAIVTELMWQRQIDIARTAQFLWNTRARSLIMPAIDRAEKALSKSLLQSEQQQSAEQLSSLSTWQVDDISVNIMISDAQGKLNINNLQQITQLTNFSHFFASRLPDLGQEKSRALAQQIFAWISANSNDNNNAFSALSYSVPHQEMRDISTLRLLPLITPARFSTLSRDMVALPGITALNINSLSASTLFFLDPTITQSAAQQIIDQRNAHGKFNKVNDFLALPACQVYTIDTKQLTAISDYFMVTITLRNAENIDDYTALLARSFHNQRIVFRILWLQRGVV